ncbi:MAG TPA: HdeA/HdeB family chaperone [Anaeromyxobacteraceae bacterium]|nr:HdeA/HdeB family chaperone [Anaeromyxobacteraceae bacterium]
MARCRVAVRALAAVVAAVSLVPRLAHAAPPSAGSSDKTTVAKTTQFSVKSGSCREFLGLPDALRGLVVAWTAGRYHTLGGWVLDEASAAQVVTGVEQACKASPEASFRYQVVGQVKKLR